MTQTRRWWIRMVGILMLVGVVSGCNGGDHDDDHHDHNGDICFLFGEREPNDTSRTAQFLDDMFLDDCFIVEGSLGDTADVDTYRVLIHESLTLVVTLDHSPLVDFDVQLFDADTGQLILDCSTSAVPEICSVPFVVRARDIAVDIVVTSVLRAGTYTLALDAH
jgi:hypothetical protein